MQLSLECCLFAANRFRGVVEFTTLPRGVSGRKSQGRPHRMTVQLRWYAQSAQSRYIHILQTGSLDHVFVMIPYLLGIRRFTIGVFTSSQLLLLEL